jgi:hypothetical protein
VIVEDSNKEDSKEEYEGAEEEYEEVEEEIEDDYREELMCDIEVIIREKKKNMKLNKKEDTQELEKIITNLKGQIEEDKRIEKHSKNS